MKIVNENGQCLECGEDTNIQLDCGKYACLQCLNRLAKETNNVKEYIENLDFSDNCNFILEKCDELIEFLTVCKDNNINTTDSIINTLNAIKIQFEYKIGTLDKEKLEKIEKQLDIFSFL